MLSNVNGGKSLEPERFLRIKIEKSQRKELFAQLQKFADEHAFRFVLTEYKRIDHFLVELWGDDILITVSDVPPDPSLVYIFFYGKYPSAPVDEEAVDDLLTELKSFIGEIPNVTITEESG